MSRLVLDAALVGDEPGTVRYSRGDRAPALTGSLRDETGQVVPLTGTLLVRVWDKRTRIELTAVRRRRVHDANVTTGGVA